MYVASVVCNILDDSFPAAISLPLPLQKLLDLSLDYSYLVHSSYVWFGRDHHQHFVLWILFPLLILISKLFYTCFPLSLTLILNSFNKLNIGGQTIVMKATDTGIEQDGSQVWSL